MADTKQINFTIVPDDPHGAPAHLREFLRDRPHAVRLHAHVLRGAAALGEGPQGGRGRPRGARAGAREHRACRCRSCRTSSRRCRSTCASSPSRRRRRRGARAPFTEPAGTDEDPRASRAPSSARSSSSTRTPTPSCTTRTPFELLVATILSAQSTDARRERGDAGALRALSGRARAGRARTTAELEPLIHATGFFRQKARALIGHGAGASSSATAARCRRRWRRSSTCRASAARPRTSCSAMRSACPGCPSTGTCSASRTGSASPRSDDPETVEQQLGARCPPERGRVASDTLILHGRRICKPKPLCDRCAVRADCDDFQRGAAGPSAAARRRRARRPRAVGPRVAGRRHDAANGSAGSSSEALDTIPGRFRQHLANVAIVVEDEPSPDSARGDGDRAARHAVRPVPGHAADRAALGLRQHACPTASRSYQGPIEDVSRRPRTTSSPRLARR